MRYAVSLTRRAALAVAAGTLAAGALLFTAGVLVGASAAAPVGASAFVAEADAAVGAAPAAAAADSATGPQADCPPVPSPASGTSSAPAAGFAPAEFSLAGSGTDGRTAGTFRDERRALAVRQRYEARGVEAVIEAWAGPDGEPVFRVVTGGAP